MLQLPDSRFLDRNGRSYSRPANGHGPPRRLKMEIIAGSRLFVIHLMAAAMALFANTALGATIVVTPPDQDIWTTSVFSFTGGGGGPGGGLADDLLKVGGWGDEYYSLLQF